mgnify:CR=1 FL=1
MRSPDRLDIDSERHRLAGTLGVSPDITPTDLQTRFKQLAKIHHPDRGGDADFMMVITEAHDRLLDLIEGSERALARARIGGTDGWVWADEATPDDEASRTRMALALLVLPVLALVLLAITWWFVASVG